MYIYYGIYLLSCLDMYVFVCAVELFPVTLFMCSSMFKQIREMTQFEI